MTEPLSNDRLAEIRAGLEGVTPGPYTPCTHLRSKEGDDACSCGYRGGVWSTATDEIIFEMGGTAEHDGTKMVPEPDRDTRRLNAQHLARLDPQTVSALLARLDKAEAGWSIEALLSAYEAHTRALPLGAASREKGDSAYNWRMSVVRDLRDLATLPPPPSSES